MSAKPMTIDAFRKWRASRTAIPWAELEATVIEVAALEQILKDSPEPILKRALKAEATLADLDTRVRLVLADLRDVAEVEAVALRAAVAGAIKDLHEALQRVVKLTALKEKR